MIKVARRQRRHNIRKKKMAGIPHHADFFLLLNVIALDIDFSKKIVDADESS
jgi:hypothetical protein